MPLSSHARQVMVQSCTDAAAVDEIVGILNALMIGSSSPPQALGPTDSPMFSYINLGPGGVRVNGSKVVGTQQPTIVNASLTATTGTLPAVSGRTTIANAATPTVVELLDLCVELLAVQTALVNTLKAHGLIV